jgi:hypothetical protein
MLSSHLNATDLVATSGIVHDDDAQSLLGLGKELKNSKPRKEDIVRDVDDEPR